MLLRHPHKCEGRVLRKPWVNVLNSSIDSGIECFFRCLEKVAFLKQVVYTSPTFLGILSFCLTKY
jgi:hypothetical protein